MTDSKQPSADNQKGWFQKKWEWGGDIASSGKDKAKAVVSGTRKKTGSLLSSIRDRWNSNPLPDLTALAQQRRNEMDNFAASPAKGESAVNSNIESTIDFEPHEDVTLRGMDAFMDILDNNNTFSDDIALLSTIITLIGDDERPGTPSLLKEMGISRDAMNKIMQAVFCKISKRFVSESETDKLIHDAGYFPRKVYRTIFNLDANPTLEELGKTARDFHDHISRFKTLYEFFTDNEGNVNERLIRNINLAAKSMKDNSKQDVGAVAAGHHLPLNKKAKPELETTFDLKEALKMIQEEQFPEVATRTPMVAQPSFEYVLTNKDKYPSFVFMETLQRALQSSEEDFEDVREDLFGGDTLEEVIDKINMADIGKKGHLLGIRLMTEDANPLEIVIDIFNLDRNDGTQAIMKAAEIFIILKTIYPNLTPGA